MSSLDTNHYTNGMAISEFWTELHMYVPCICMLVGQHALQNLMVCAVKTRLYRRLGYSVFVVFCGWVGSRVWGQMMPVGVAWGQMMPVGVAWGQMMLVGVAWGQMMPVGVHMFVPVVDVNNLL